MRQRWEMTLGIVVLAILGIPPTSFAASAPARKPNIVFVLSDDHNHALLGIAGHPLLKTPNLDKVAKEGAWLRQACVVTPLCAPSRTAFLTGLYGHRSNFRTNNGPWPEALPPSFLSTAHDAGYKTAFIGKKHIYNTDDSLPGVDRWVSFVNQGLFVNPFVNIDGKRSRLEGANGDLLTGFAVDFIKENKDKPFAMMVAYKEAHSQQTAPSRFNEDFSNDAVSLPETFNEDKSTKPKFFTLTKQVPDSGFDDSKPRNQAGPPEGTREELAVKKIKNYLRCIKALDDYVGKITAALQEAGQLDNTIFVFAGDNGYFLGDHGRFEKMTPHEESVRVPYLIRYPAVIKPGTVSDAFVLNIDLAPTLYDLAGLQGPKGLDGKSLKPILTGNTSGWRQDVYLEWQGNLGALPPNTPGTVGDPTAKKAAAKAANKKAATKKANNPAAAGPGIPTWRAVRNATHKYSVYLNGDLSELYDLKNDPKETKNLVTDPAHKDDVVKMHKRLLELADETKDPLRDLIPAEPKF